MKSFNLNSDLIISLHLLLALFAFYPTISSSQLVLPDPIKDLACKAINCGEGTCKPSNETLLGFDCECNPGWKKAQIGALIFPSCVVPDCTIDFKCDGTPSPPPPSDPLPPACSFVWCGDGTCIANGTTGYLCKCSDGSYNLLDLPGLACFKPCYLGGDCKSKGFTSPESSNSHSSQENRISLTIFLVIPILLTTWISEFNKEAHI